MTLTDLEILVEFHYWATKRILDAVEPLTPDQFTKDLGNSFPSVRDTLAHLYGADWIWCSRWEGESPSALPDAQLFPDLASIRRAWDAHEPKVRAVLKRFGEMGVDQLLFHELWILHPETQVVVLPIERLGEPCSTSANAAIQEDLGWADPEQVITESGSDPEFLQWL